MVKTYHTMDKSEWAELAGIFHPQHGSHYIDLPTGRILVATTFASEWAEEQFATKATTRQSLPHPVFEGTDKLSDRHVAELAHLGIKPGHTVRDVIKIASAVHPLMRLSAF